MGMLDRPRYEGEPAWERLFRGMVGLISDRPRPRRVCHDCSVDYIPDLTEDRCPICGARAVETVLAIRRTRRRDLAGLGLVWLVGLVVFLLLVHALYG
jgi:hypothetical protein